jgi:hypothetical protein
LDTITCTLSYTPSCFASILSNKLGITVNPKPNLGPDTTVNLTCQGCTINLNNLYNITGYLYAAWNTSSPVVSSPGIYRLIVSQLNGCTCPDSDTALAFVAAYSGFSAQTCAGSNFSFMADITGSTYQWQVNTGSGFVNLQAGSHIAGMNSRQLYLTDIPSLYYGNKYRCLVNGSTYSSIYSLKITAYWTGAFNKDWENPGNWSCGAVPDKNTDIIIEAGKLNYPEINCNRACRSINAAPGTSVRIKTDKLLMMMGGN